MKQSRNERIANVEVTITLLQQQERRLQAIISSALSSPEIKAQALKDLSELIVRIERKTSELRHLESEQ